jgi:hypothetical protein
MKPQRIYNPSTLTPEEKKYSDRFVHIQREFGDNYRIYVVNQDFKIGAGIVRVDSQTDISDVVFKIIFCSVEPLKQNIIEYIRSYLLSNTIDDEEIEC